MAKNVYILKLKTIIQEVLRKWNGVVRSATPKKEKQIKQTYMHYEYGGQLNLSVFLRERGLERRWQEKDKDNMQELSKLGNEMSRLRYRAPEEKAYSKEDGDVQSIQFNILDSFG